MSLSLSLTHHLQYKHIYSAHLSTKSISQSSLVYIGQYQTLVTDLENDLQSMGLVMKASKCLSLSIQRGQTTKVQFYLKTNSEYTFSIYSVLEKPMKFLGR